LKRRVLAIAHQVTSFVEQHCGTLFIFERYREEFGLEL
jgi:hypothetical protein